MYKYIAYPIGRCRPNDTRACRLHNHRLHIAKHAQSGVAARTTRGLDKVFLFSPLDFTRSGRLSAYAPALTSRLHITSHTQSGVAARTTRGRVVSTIVVSTLRSMPNRALPPERHEGSIRYSCSVHWTSLARADSVLTHLPSLHVSTLHRILNRALPPERHEGVSSPQSSSPHCEACPIGRCRPNDTRAR